MEIGSQVRIKRQALSGFLRDFRTKVVDRVGVVSSVVDADRVSVDFPSVGRKHELRDVLFNVAALEVVEGPGRSK